MTSAGAAAATVTRITVSGQGTVSVTPDEAVIRASIETNADRAADAISQANTIYTRAVAAVTSLGVARTDVTLDYYNFNYNPRPSPQPGQIAPTGQFGFIVTRTFEVKVRGIDKAGPVVDALTQAGITSIGSVTFQASDTSRARSSAITKAMADARAKADDAAKAAGLHITGIEQVGYANYIATPAPVMRMAVAADTYSAPTVLDSGGISVSETLTVTFLAGP